MNSVPPTQPWEQEILNQIDGHWCYDWDGLPVSAFTPEYDCCVCFKKTLLGRACNWFFMFRLCRAEEKARAKESKN